MAEPLEFQIVQNLQTALRSISIANGYHHNVGQLAVKLDADHDVASLIGDNPLRPFLILELPPDSWEYPQQSGQVLLLIPFKIHAVNDTPPVNDVAPRDDDALLRTYLRLCADVEKSIAVDETRGLLATDTRILRREMHEIDGQQVWAMLTGEIREHRTYGAPNG